MAKGSSLQKIESRAEKGTVMIVLFFLTGLPLLIQSNILFSNITAKEFLSNLS